MPFTTATTKPKQYSNMARSFKISKKLYHLEKLLSDCVFGALEVTDIVINGQSHPEHMVERKIDAFDLIFDLSLDEQAKLFEYRAFKARAREGIWEKYDVDQLAELARSLGHKDLDALEIWAMKERWNYFPLEDDPNVKIDTGKIVSDYLDGGQQRDDGVKLKRHLDQLLNGDASERVEIID